MEFISDTKSLAAKTNFGRILPKIFGTANFYFDFFSAFHFVLQRVTFKLNKRQHTCTTHHTTKNGSAQQPRCSGSGGGAAAAPAGKGGSGVALLGLRRGRAADALATAEDDDRCALAGGGAGRGGQRRGVGPLTRRLAGAAASLCSARVWAGTLTCRLAGGGAGRGGQRRGVWGAAARGRAADASARAARSPAVAPAGGGAALASLGSRRGLAAHALATADDDDGDGATGDDDDGDGATSNGATGATTMDDDAMGSGAMGYDDDDDNGCWRGRDPAINKRWKGGVGGDKHVMEGGGLIIIKVRNFNQ